MPDVVSPTSAVLSRPVTVLSSSTIGKYATMTVLPFGHVDLTEPQMADLFMACNLKYPKTSLLSRSILEY